MPSSRPAIISLICEIILGYQPKSIADLGMGFGKIGVLAREYTDIWNGRYDAKLWETRIDGVEGFKNYIQPWHNEIYTNIYPCLIEEFKPEITYDLILLIDVLEHFEKPTGKKVLDMIIRNSKSAIIATPQHVLEQGAVNGNQLEIHRSQWLYDDLQTFGKVFLYGKTLVLNTGIQLLKTE